MCDKVPGYVWQYCGVGCDGIRLKKIFDEVNQLKLRGHFRSNISTPNDGFSLGRDHNLRTHIKLGWTSRGLILSAPFQAAGAHIIMEITRFIVERRNDALVVGDYGIYRKALSRRILTLRRRLGRTTAKGRKYIQKAPITSDDVTSDIESVISFDL